MKINPSKFMLRFWGCALITKLYLCRWHQVKICSSVWTVNTIFFVYFIVIYLTYYSLCVHVTCMVCYVVHAIRRLGCPFKLYMILEQDTGCLSGTDGKCKSLFSLSYLVSPLASCLFNEENVDMQIQQRIRIVKTGNNKWCTNKPKNKQTKKPKDYTSDHLGKGKKWVFPITPDRTWLNEYQDFPTFSLQNFERTYFYCSKPFNLWYFLTVKWFRS